MATLLLLASVGLHGCATLPRDAVPMALADRSSPAGFTDIRIWGDAPLSDMSTRLSGEAKSIRRLLDAKIRRGEPAEVDFLALSGGAEDGAFGAGLLFGWTRANNRPEFELVTGVSAGALIAPFAFLGPTYDPLLHEMFTTLNRDNIATATVLSGLLGGPALMDSAPLKALIDRYIDRGLMQGLARERARGRILLICTTNIDAQRPVYWDVGRIAQSNDTRALELIRDILLASASLPTIFPPVRIAVKAGGKNFEELHVDGGPTREVFFLPQDFHFAGLEEAVGMPFKRRLFVIRNGHLGADYKVTEEASLALAVRSISTLIKSQAQGDLFRIYASAIRESVDFNLAAIPEGTPPNTAGPFDKAYMASLFAIGEKAGSRGVRWLKQPPGWERTQ